MMWHLYCRKMYFGLTREDPYAAMCWHVRDAQSLDAAGATGSWGFVWVRSDYSAVIPGFES